MKKMIMEREISIDKGEMYGEKRQRGERNAGVVVVAVTVYIMWKQYALAGSRPVS